MDNNTLDVIIKKLDALEQKISHLGGGEKSKVSTSEVSGGIDPVFLRALDLIQEYDEISEEILEKRLQIPRDRVTKIIDTLVKAGYIEASV
ncbi:MAG: helix-turn-helix domain-containing protein [bacterium]|nr:helix-turn-helix domain-containing protein [bacterium]